MSYEYSEDNLIEQTAIDLFFNQLGWDNPCIKGCFNTQTNERTNRSLRNKISILHF